MIYSSSYSSWDIEQKILKFVILGHFLPFYPPKNTKNQNLEEWKNLLDISSFYFICTKNHNHMMYSSWDTEWDRQRFLSFWANLCPLITAPPPLPWNRKKIMISFYTYIHAYHKWISYDTWFLKDKVWQTVTFIILGHFLPFQPLDNPENQNPNIEKETPGDIIILHICTINDNDDVWFLRYGAWQT